MTAVLDSVMAVMNASFDPHFREAWTRKQIVDSLALPSTFVLLVDAMGQRTDGSTEASGFVLARQAADEVELLLIAVDPRWRGSGLGEMLLTEFARESAHRGATKAFLEVRANNPARKLYERAGFAIIGERPQYYRTAAGDYIDAITYGRSLS